MLQQLLLLLLLLFQILPLESKIRRPYTFPSSCQTLTDVQSVRGVVWQFNQSTNLCPFWFIAEFDGERILKIGQHLAKLQARLGCPVLFDSRGITTTSDHLCCILSSCGVQVSGSSCDVCCWIICRLRDAVTASVDDTVPIVPASLDCFYHHKQIKYTRTIIIPWRWWF